MVLAKALCSPGESLRGVKQYLLVEDEDEEEEEDEDEGNLHLHALVLNP